MEAVVERVGMMVSDGLSFHHDRRKPSASRPTSRSARGRNWSGTSDAHYNSWQAAAAFPPRPAASSAHFRAHSAAISITSGAAFVSSADRPAGEDFHFTFSPVSFFIRGKNPLGR